MLLVAEGLSKSFQRRVVVSEFNLELRAGEVVGFVGPNGAGKTTTMKMLCGLLRPDRGKITLLGTDLSKQRDTFLAHVGCVIDSPAFYPSLSAIEHLLYLSRIRRQGKRQNITAILEQVGIAEHATRPVGQFSTGMKQRLAIAAAMLHSPNLMLLDEPTNGLDPIGIVAIRDLIRQLSGKRNVSILLSSHLLHEIEQVCGRVVFIRDGKLLREECLSTSQEPVLSRVCLRTGNNAAAIQVLEKSEHVRLAVLADSGIECVVTSDQIADIPYLLVRAGIPIYELSPVKQTLEKVYVANYNGGEQ